MKDSSFCECKKPSLGLERDVWYCKICSKPIKNLIGERGKNLRKIK